MALIVRSVSITASLGGLTRFEIEGLVHEEEDFVLLRNLIYESHGNLDLLRSVASCEWCGSLYPKKDLRCRKGCGGPRTKT